ncbi:LacI family DNA-binding transcriptional regulator [Bordetella hinzii]|uniref:LacI family transcriptional regulator n=2 Tax=Bordetella hinzii TaxID=103855 RepID=A0AAN1RZN0_9BORD|nr:LacI family DNA-binding transcriptional regulator [Bordetella hinzii]AKQ55677.1 HTH-type transcriptional repressor PurR [Bordetella hinzii]AKQ60180.1 HTH-type transcriptional repressor PurR [Bordetella hinzii]AZW18740.1 LacI family transcriptional regulator [Bordetella hinzii]KCB21742.1 small molecule-binding regulator domain protein [Bordetella hinzii L60]KCB24471.1 periplasmic-binding protein-like domain protein [Bordetella hinzii OH87 BAL007II]
MTKNSPDLHKPITLRALAAKLNVHISTVSRVLNGSEEDARSAAAPETVALIRELAAQHNYRPNPYATSLKTKKTRTVGVLVPRLSDLVLATIYEGIDAAATREGYWTVVANTEDKVERHRQVGEMMLGRHVDGLVFADARLDDSSFIESIHERGIPMVLASRHLGPQYCTVACDDAEGGRLAAAHLLDLGHERVAVLAGERFASTGYDRAMGFVEHCRSRGVTVPGSWLLHSQFDTGSGRELGNRLLSGKTRPTAVFAVNDFLAIGLMGAARDQGLQPGKDIAIVGFNDTPLAAELPIPLTSIKSSMHQMGLTAMELLLERIAGKSPASVRLRPELVVRASSGGVLA